MTRIVNFRLLKWVQFIAEPVEIACHLTESVIYGIHQSCKKVVGNRPKKGGKIFTGAKNGGTVTGSIS